MEKIRTQVGRFFVALLVMLLTCSVLSAAASSAQQLEKGIQLFEQNKDDAAMEMFIDVLVNGSRAEAEEANKYINMIHNRIGGIQEGVEVSEDYKEGALSRLKQAQDPAVVEQQIAAEEAANAQQVEQARLALEEAQRQADIAQEELLQQQSAVEQPVSSTLKEDTLAAQYAAAQAAPQTQAAPSTSSTFTDLTSPAALQARRIYTAQKLESMQQAAIAKLTQEKGVRVYFRNGRPDAIDIDDEVLFDGYKFRTDAFPVLNEIYTLMALTQGAGFVILPPGSYTDNITLSGIRHAMALNSFLVHKGLSSGKLSYNMGLYDQEPPAKFANLDGLSIVFDYDAQLPASLPDATSVSKLPLLSMAVVPVSNQIKLSAGEAFAIDFSVIETENAIENWVLQVVQHAAKDTYYVVRQLEGFSPVYHQILWNGRKGIIGKELACGKYTLALTATDVQGAKRTLRRQVEVLCPGAEMTEKESPTKKTLNYKQARLWQKPGRVMRTVVSSSYEAASPTVPNTSSVTHTDVNKEVTYTELPDGTIETRTKTTTTTTTDHAAATAVAGAGTTGTQGVVNPYDMPYED